ncbi:DUF190 domain-containing protein [Pseudomonas sp. AO-1]|uniref:DUF190 domain-containing protein n=1 Tax=Pseudomonas sp. AO-1 TaxID=2855434 RepID=UPI001C785337|nr:DUF190 domain-containing protein [Pseudomonas sp. AO-1]QXZ14642.1 DUF190 domain-containing protein [Pseudomonas sp. AO-1]
MKGYQLTFFTEQNARHQHKPMGEWLLDFAKQQGALGGTLVTGAEGFDQAGHFHSAHFFELADQPIAVTVSMDEKGCQRLLTALAQEHVDVAYVKVPVEYGRIGAAS